jgi:ABC-2 type transport system ATP-binding protein
MYDIQVGHPPTAAGDRSAGDSSPGVLTEGLGKRFGDLWALRDLDLTVPPGRVLGLLGHNGAGKTTAIRILTTLSRPTTGRASVAGFDVATRPGEVRRRIGVAAQAATVDGLLSGRTNLYMVGRLHHLSRADSRQRADELLEAFDLTDAADRMVKTFSGGMRRRVDLAAALVAHPRVLFLDEPTTGLDPRSRNNLWDLLRELVRQGTTIVLTTQYLEEADQLADDIVVLDHGRVVASGTPSELKARVGQDRIIVTLPAARDLDPAVAAARPFATGDPVADTETLSVTLRVGDGVRVLDVLRALDDAGVEALDLNRRQSTLDDVFLSLTAPGRAEAAPQIPLPDEVPA